MAEDETIVSEGDFSIIRDKFELEKKLPFIIKQLEKIGCEKYEIVESIDGNNIDNPSPIKNGAYGLVMTYVKLYEEIKKLTILLEQRKDLQHILLMLKNHIFC